jgi:hypothetical protein
VSKAGHADRLDRVRAGGHLLKLPRRSGPPLALEKTSAPWSSSVKTARCSRSAGMITSGIPTIRRPEKHFVGRPLDIGAPYPDGARVQVEIASPERRRLTQRKLAKVARSTRA